MTLRELISTYVGHKTVAEMAAMSKFSETTIRNYAFKMGLSIMTNSRKEKKAKLLELVKHFHWKYTAEELAEMTGYTRQSCYLKAWEMGKKLKGMRNWRDESKEFNEPLEGIFDECERENWLV